MGIFGNDQMLIFVIIFPIALVLLKVSNICIFPWNFQFLISLNVEIKLIWSLLILSLYDKRGKSYWENKSFRVFSDYPVHVSYSKFRFFVVSGWKNSGGKCGLKNYYKILYLYVINIIGNTLCIMSNLH